jgi:hypothetical protein
MTPGSATAWTEKQKVRGPATGRGLRTDEAGESERSEDNMTQETPVGIGTKNQR